LLGLLLLLLGQLLLYRKAFAGRVQPVKVVQPPLKPLASAYPCVQRVPVAVAGFVR